MSPAWVRPREVKRSPRNPRGRSYQVLFRRGGRLFPIESAGTFKTEREAKIRRDLVAGWLAAGLNPRDELARLLQAPPQLKTPDVWVEEWLTAQHQLADKSEKQYRNGTTAILARLHVTDLRQVTVADCQRVVGELAASYAVPTVHSYWRSFKQLLDYAGVDPNPARDRRIRLPKLKQSPPNVPTANHVAAILAMVRPKYVLPLVTLEQTAMRVESIEVLTWGVVDVTGNRLRLEEKGGKVRWAPIPAWLMRQLEQTCPLEDRGNERKLFPGITAQGLRAGMARACVLARVPHYHPHELRHRRASLWHLQGIPDAILAERLGHERASFSKDVYVHVMPVEEIPGERLEALVVEARR